MGKFANTISTLSLVFATLSLYVTVVPFAESRHTAWWLIPLLLVFIAFLVWVWIWIHKTQNRAHVQELLQMKYQVETTFLLDRFDSSKRKQLKAFLEKTKGHIPTDSFEYMTRLITYWNYEQGK